MRPRYLSKTGLFLRGWCVITGAVAGNVLSGLQGYQPDWTFVNWLLLILGAYVTMMGSLRAWLDQSISDMTKPDGSFVSEQSDDN